MTSNSRLKKQARAYAAEHGVAYADARRHLTEPGTGEPGRREWAVVAYDKSGVTVEKTGPDPEALVNEVASWAQQEQDRWPELGLIYMLITPEEVPAARAQETSTAVGMQRVLTIQQAQRIDGVLPYPFHIDEHGFVGRQDFWKGSPFRLVGFVEDEDSYDVSLTAQDWLAAEDPAIAVGKHPVLMDRDGGFATYTGAVEAVTVTSVPRTGPEAVTARVVTSDSGYDLTVGVGHLLEYLHAEDLTTLRAAGWAGPSGSAAAAVTETLLGWLLVADGGQNVDEVYLLFEHLDTHSVGVEVTLDPNQAEAWLTHRHPGLG